MTVDSISPSEKLNVISRQDNSGHAPSDTIPFTKPRGYRRSCFPLRKTFSIGVDIGYRELKLIKLIYANSQWKIADYENIPIPTQIKEQSIAFVDFLRSSLLFFCGKYKKYQIWTTISDAYIELKHITIPISEKMHIPKSVRWVAKKEIGFDKSKHIIDFELQGRVEVDGILKRVVIVYIAEKKRVEGLKNLFFRCGYPLTGITVSPFAAQNMIRTGWLDTGEAQLKFDEDIATFYIGSDYSRINIFHRQNLALTRNIKAGTSSMIDALRSEFRQDEHYGSLSEDDVRKIFFSLLPEYFIKDEQVYSTGLTDEMIIEKTSDAIDRLIRQAERTFEHYSIIYNGERKVKKIFLCGEITGCAIFTDYVSSHMSIEQAVMDPIGENRFLSAAISSPITLSKRAVFVRSVGLALSSNKTTPNLLLPYEKKEKEKMVSLVNRCIGISFVILFITLLGFFFFQLHEKNKRLDRLSALKAKLKQSNPYIDQTFILEMAAKVKQSIKRKKNFINKYLLLAITNDIVSNVGENIRLSSCSIVLNKHNNDKGAAKAKQNDIKGEKKEQAEKSIYMDGIVLGDAGLLEAHLVGYIVRLFGSPLFSNIEVHKLKRERSRTYGEVLSFSVKMKIESV